MADLTSLWYSWGMPLMRFTTDQGSFTCEQHGIPPDLAIEIVVLFLHRVLKKSYRRLKLLRIYGQER